MYRLKAFNVTGPHGVTPQGIDICQEDIDAIKYQTVGKYDKYNLYHDEYGLNNNKRYQSMSDRFRAPPSYQSDTDVDHEESSPISTTRHQRWRSIDSQQNSNAY